MNNPLQVPYGFRNPATDYDPLPSWGDHPLEAKVAGWVHSLKTFRIGQKLVPDAGVLPVGAVVEGEWLCDCVQYLPPFWPEAPWIQNIAGHRLVNDDEGLRLVLKTPRDPLVLEGSWCVLNDFVAHRNIAHFFREEVAQLAAIRELRQAHPTLRVLARPSAYANINLMRELLLPQALVHGRPAGGMGNAPVLQVESLLLQPIAYSGGQGFYPVFLTHEYWLALNEFRQGLACLRQALDEIIRGNNGIKDAWICFSRDLHQSTEASQGRHFTNYPELLETLSNRGVIVLDPGRFAITDIVSLIRSARGFIGIHGAGLANTLLANQGSRVVEIRSYCGVSPGLEVMGKAAGLDWHFINSPRAPDGSDRGVIPIEAVMALIEAPP